MEGTHGSWTEITQSAYASTGDREESWRRREIKATIAPVSCEHHRRTGRSNMFYLKEHQPPIHSDQILLLPDYHWLTQSVNSHSQARLRAMSKSTCRKVNYPNEGVRLIHATSH